MFNLINHAKALSQSNLPTLTPVTTGSFKHYVIFILNAVLIIAGILAVIYLIYGGILYITASGDAEKATKGRTAVVNAIIGIVIILLAVVLVQWVNSLITQGPTTL